MIPHHAYKPIDPNGVRLFLIRHGETVQPDRFHGSESDIALGERGRAQSTEAAECLRPWHPRQVYCSRMLRARQTAEILAATLGLPVPTVVDDLHERRMAALSGRPKTEAWPIYERDRNLWMAGDLDATHDGAESYRMIAERVVPRLVSIVASQRGQSIVVVAHGVVIRVLLTQLIEGATPADFERFGIDCAAVNALDFDGTRWTAWHLNGRPVLEGTGFHVAGETSW